MSAPQPLAEFQRFLGMVNYLGKFIPNLAEVTAPFQVLLKKDIVFNLQKSQLDAIEKLKTYITSELDKNRNVMIRNCRHLIPINEKFTKKFSYNNIIPPNNKLLERVTPLQTANS